MRKFWKQTADTYRYLQRTSLFCTPVRTHASQAPEHLGQGLTQGMMYFGHTVKDGITGVVMKPIRGAKKGGAVGFMKGVGQGVVGLVAAPVSGETV